MDPADYLFMIEYIKDAQDQKPPSYGQWVMHLWSFWINQTI